jgi:HK97 gp10 family phage protein
VRRGFTRALTAAAVPVFEAIDARCPVDTGEMKGQLKTVIEIDEQARGGTASLGYGTGINGHKSNWVEYGHRLAGHKPKLKDMGAVQPHPFMRPAAAESAEAAIDAFAEALRDRGG